MKFVNFLGWVIVTLFILLVLFFTARFLFCGPNREVIKVAKPVVQIIADDIVNNGIPESLSDIEGLPYGLEGCSRKIRYRKMAAPIIDVQLRKEADFAIITETCFFIENNKVYSINLWFLEDYQDKESSHGKVKIFNSETHTGIGASFTKQNNTYKYDPIGKGYAHYHGILCSSFKQ